MSKLEKLTEMVKSHLDGDENILHSVQGAYETKIMGSESVRQGAFFATNKRLVFYAKKMIGYDMEVFPYKSISSIEVSKGMLGHKISFFSSGNKAVMKWISDGNVVEFVSFVKETITGAQSKLDNSTSAKSSDSLDALERLAALKEKGVLTEEEFNLEKKKIFDR